MIEDNLTSMAQIARANGIRVVLASITPVYDYPWKPKTFPTDIIRAVNQWIQTFCATHNFTYLDYYTAMSDPTGAMLPGLSSDGVHPLAKGYAIMAPLAEKAIAEAESHKP
jgi:lysophospholipase L1-like esterase